MLLLLVILGNVRGLLALAGEEYLLDNYFSPKHYDIAITLDANFIETKNFIGVEEVVVVANKAENVVRLHVGNDIYNNGPKIFVNRMAVQSNLNYNNATEILDIPLGKTPKVNDTIKLKFEYTGKLYEDMTGFYLSKVEQSEEVIAVTQFQATKARKAFPCFDEPSFKSTFAIKFSTPKEYSVVSNQPGMETIESGVKKTVFQQTPVMSTYLVAFLVSKYGQKKVDGNLIIPMTIHAPKHIIKNADFAAEVSYKILESLSNELNNGPNNIAFDHMNVKHFDQMTIPDFSSGAMENWGLVAYKESKFLWNSTDSTIRAKEDVIRYICHEFSHFWFGNWVTTRWWNTTWLNEGFANYFEYHGLTNVAAAKQFELVKQFVVNEIIDAMEIDGGSSVLPLTSQAYTPQEIAGRFGTITYSKGASILRMLRNIYPDTFLSILNGYIYQNREKVVDPETLLSAFPGVKNLDADIFMKNWFEKPGYPIVELTETNLDSEHNLLTLSQKQFFYSKANTSKNTEWYVPIWYIDLAQNKPVQFANFLRPNSNMTLKVFKNSTVLFNPNKMGYYRVNYNQRQWDDIVDILTTNHTFIDVITRAQLVDDALNLARAGELSYDTAFGLLDYLKGEEEYYPWKAATLAFSYLEQRVSDKLWKSLSSRINFWMQNLWNIKKGFVIDEKMPAIEIYTKLLAVQWRCFLDNDDCIKDANATFVGTSITRLGPINANVRHVVYCSTLRHSKPDGEDQRNWNSLWKTYKKSLVADEKDSLLASLGCAQNPTILMKYLKLSLDINEVRQHSNVKVLQAVLDGNPNATNLVIEFLDTSFDDIPLAYMKKALSVLGNRLKTDEMLNQFKAFTKKHQTDLKKLGLEKSVDNVIDSAQECINWTQHNEDLIDKSLSSGVNNIHGSINVGVLFISVLVPIAKFYN